MVFRAIGTVEPYDASMGTRHSKRITGTTQRRKPGQQANPVKLKVCFHKGFRRKIGRKAKPGDDQNAN
jgi:hypothetical protein